MPPKKKMKMTRKKVGGPFTRQDMHTIAQETTTFLFFKLPAEMRNMIYGLAILDHDNMEPCDWRLKPPPVLVRSRKLGKWKSHHRHLQPAYPALSQVNRQTRYEFLSLYHVDHGLPILPRHIAAYVEEFYGSPGEPLPGPPHKGSLIVRLDDVKWGPWIHRPTMRLMEVEFVEQVLSVVNANPTFRCRFTSKSDEHVAIANELNNAVLNASGSTVAQVSQD
ncbi:hypothetical protein BDW02DRAFT_609173 [Decorospora gaudefroyi]|uniref:Uncharacterized protein n=1 Tax=Decorospora gaudefroyi TaxID=184978 RepID=A0A6A5KRK5_9PLEO|nr:hypothetical protein BDW02DRAFT_609173 [Decorospora gaudefroyi]